MLEKNNFYVVLIAPNCADCLRPFDISDNKAVKCQLHAWWYAEQVCQQHKEGEEKKPIDLLKAEHYQAMSNM